jgi:hypothetical protein
VLSFRLVMAWDVDICRAIEAAHGIPPDLHPFLFPLPYSTWPVPPSSASFGQWIGHHAANGVRIAIVSLFPKELIP